MFANGDTRRQLLARSRHLLFKPKEWWINSQCERAQILYLLFKSEEKWCLSQWERAQILFHEYSDIKKAYKLSYKLYGIYNRFSTPEVARTHLAHWYNEIDQSGFDAFNTVRRTFQNHQDTIINYFNGMSTNAAAEAFNAKIKEFRRQFRGVTDVKFFLYHLCKIYA